MNPFASIWDDASAPKPKPVPKPKPKADHSEARKIYEAYLVKSAELKKHKEYALQVAKATDGPGRTPVKPLATMGSRGGPLLCDHCLKPIILESGPYYNVPADVAWAHNTKRDEKWVSYIKGGMIVEIVENETLRIYHGYAGTPCCYTTAKNERDLAEARYVRDLSKAKAIYEFLADEFPGQDPNIILSDVMKLMFSFDPGLGVNQPCGS